MRRGGLRALALVAVAFLGVSLVSSFAARPAAADQGTASQAVDQLNQQLQQQQQQLDHLANDARQAQNTVDRKNQELQTVAAREAALRTEMHEVARVEYQRPALTLSTILQARTLDQLISGVAQARLVAKKEQSLYQRSRELHEQSVKARNEASTQLTRVMSDRNQAARIVSQTQSTLQAAEEQVRAEQQRAAEAQAAAQRAAQQQAEQQRAAQAEAARIAQQQAAAAQQAAQAAQAKAQAVNQQAQTQVAAAPAGSIQQIITNAFAPQGQAAVDWGLRIAKCESGYNPYAQNPSGASGLFQFMPSTFANTPPGRAGGSIWDPTANSQAAAWMYSQGRQGEWECN
jgi:soluble lytic murein transglycosylase-like protein